MNAPTTIPFFLMALSALAAASAVACTPSTVVSPGIRSIIVVDQSIVFNVTTGVAIQIGQQIFLEKEKAQAAAYAPNVNAGITILVDTRYAVLCETTTEGDPDGPPACIALATSLTGTAANGFINGAYKAGYLNQSQYTPAMAGSAVVFTIVDLGTGSAPESITDWASVGGTIADGGVQLYIYTIKNSTPANTTQLTIDDGSQIASLLGTIQQ